MQFLSDWSNVFHVSLWNYKGNRTNDIIMTVSIHKQTSSQNLNRQFQKLHNISEKEFAIIRKSIISIYVKNKRKRLQNILFPHIYYDQQVLKHLFKYAHLSGPYS